MILISFVFVSWKKSAEINWRKSFREIELYEVSNLINFVILTFHCLMIMINH